METKGDEDLYNTNSYEERISVIVGVVARPDDFNQVDEDETNVGEEEEVSVYTPRSCKMRSVRLYLIWGEMQT